MFRPPRERRGGRKQSGIPVKRSALIEVLRILPSFRLFAFVSTDRQDFCGWLITIIELLVQSPVFPMWLMYKNVREANNHDYVMRMYALSIFAFAFSPQSLLDRLSPFFLKFSEHSKAFLETLENVHPWKHIPLLFTFQSDATALRFLRPIITRLTTLLPTRCTSRTTTKLNALEPALQNHRHSSPCLRMTELNKLPFVS